MDLRRIAWIYTGLQTRLRLISSCVTSPRPPFHSFPLPPSFRYPSIYLSFPVTRSVSSPLLEVCAQFPPRLAVQDALLIGNPRSRQRLSMLICFRMSRIGFEPSIRSESLPPLWNRASVLLNLSGRFWLIEEIYFRFHRDRREYKGIWMKCQRIGWYIISFFSSMVMFGIIFKA